jgi:hypothetical protein
MPRTVRVAPGGVVYHVVHRGVGRQQSFFEDDDDHAFERTPSKGSGLIVSNNHIKES